MTYEELEMRNAELQWKLDNLLGTGLVCPLRDLNGKKFRLVNVLAARAPAFVTYEACLFAMYDEPHEIDIKRNTVKVFMHNARKALKPAGIEVETVWARGYRMSVSDAAKWQALVNQANGLERAA